MLRSWLVFCGLSLLGISAAHAEGWYVVIRGSNSSTARFISDEGLLRTGDTVEFWTADVEAVPMKVKEGGAEMKSSRTRNKVYCVPRKISALSMVGYAESGEVLFTEMPSRSIEDIAPDSIASILAGVVCDRAPFAAQQMLLVVPPDKTIFDVAKVVFRSARNVQGQ